MKTLLLALCLFSITSTASLGLAVTIGPAQSSAFCPYANNGGGPNKAEKYLPRSIASAKQNKNTPVQIRSGGSSGNAEIDSHRFGSSH